MQQTVTPEQYREALHTLAEHFRVSTPQVPRMDIVDWAERKYYLAPGSSTESMSAYALPIRLFPHQKAILRYAFHHPTLKFTTILYSTVKKSGKTAVGGLVARYLAENSGHYAEIYCIANDEEQARGRNYKAALDSIENTPGYDDHKNLLPYTREGLQQLAALGRTPDLSTGYEWRIIERQAEYTPTRSYIRALSNDYRGEAGANPTATIWSEIWGLDSEKSKKLWAELTPVPTRESIRFVETYAGFEGESVLLEALWHLCKDSENGARQLTRDDVPDWPSAEVGYRGDDYLLPLWVNEQARTFAYIDQGVQARRMPWQLGVRGEAYYAEQELTLSDPMQFTRFHFNEWTGTTSPFINMMWWKHCRADGSRPIKPLTARTPLVLAIDAAVSSDYMALIGFTREGEHTVALRLCRVWDPKDYGGRLDYSITCDPLIRALCARYNVVELAYDPWQMHKVATDLERDWVVSCYPFNQSNERLSADKQFHDLIRDRDLVYDPEVDLQLLDLDEKILDFGSEDSAFEKALGWAAIKQSRDEDTRFRIIKKGTGKIDPVVAGSMGADRTLYLNLW